MGIAAEDYEGDPLTYPVGVEQTDPAELDLFDSFKDSQGRYRTQSLFIETPHESYPAHFTTKTYNVKKNGKTYYSLYQKYMEIADPTEYQVALRLFGSWDHWQALCKSKWFMELLTGWRNELKVKMESDRYYEMVSKIDSEKDGTQATKWLADRYGAKAVLKRGRPSKAEKAAHLKKLATETDETKEDAARIGL